MSSAIQIGHTLEDKYRIEKKLASGGQGHVYRGTHLILSRPVAIKILRLSTVPEVMERMTRRFEQEARLISALRDPHTITLYDFGRVEDGSLFMIFEYIDGQSLKELLESQGRVAPHRVAKILRQTLSSLQEAHSFGVLHRDIKPANIMLYEHAGRPDQAKLLDFGIAKILNDDENNKLTAANAIVGTPRYIAPELLVEETPSPASDIYSLGLVAYELLTGQKAVSGQTPMEIFRAQVEAPSCKLPSALSVPDGLRSIVNQMLEKELHKRYAATETVLVDLKRWHDHRPVASDHKLGASPASFDPQDLTDEDYQHEAMTRQLDDSQYFKGMPEPFDSSATLVDAKPPEPLATSPHNPSALFAAIDELEPLGELEEMDTKDGLRAPQRTSASNNRMTHAAMHAYQGGPVAPTPPAPVLQEKPTSSKLLPIFSVLLFLGLTLVFSLLLWRRFG